MGIAAIITLATQILGGITTVAPSAIKAYNAIKMILGILGTANDEGRKELTDAEKAQVKAIMDDADADWAPFVAEARKALGIETD